MTRYMLTIYQPDGDLPPPEALDQIMRDVNAVTQEMMGAGVWVFHGGLHPVEAATVVRAQDHGVVTTDGPYVEGKEHIGGFTIIEVAHLDAALGWAARLARAIRPLPIEVRPLHDEPGG